VSKRVSPTERIRAEIDALFASERDLASTLEVARLGVRQMMQSAIEAEGDEFLGRARYERRDEDDRPGSRNGFQPPTAVKTTLGPVELQRPKLRDTDEAFCSRLFGADVTRTNALESLVISGCVRGLSDRDIEAALAEVLGPEAALSKSTVSRICQHPRRVRDVAYQRPVRCGPGLPVPRRQPFPHAPRRAGRTGAGRVGHRHRRQARVRGPRSGGLGVDRRVGRLPRRPPSAPPAGTPAGNQRWRTRPDIPGSSCPQLQPARCDEPMAVSQAFTTARFRSASWRSTSKPHTCRGRYSTQSGHGLRSGRGGRGAGAGRSTS
jgi:Transposase, Mutator family